MIFYGPASPKARADDRGHDPHPDDDLIQRAMTDAEYEALPADHPMKVRLARWAHQGSVDGCESCGLRCEICGDRLCARWGPEPAIRCDSHPTCVDCAEIPPCRDCGEAIRQAHEGSDW